MRPNEKPHRLEYLFQAANFVAYVARNFKLFYVVLTLTIFVLCLEYIATSLMIPMAPSQNGATGIVNTSWHYFAEKIGYTPAFRTWLWLFFFLMTVRLVMGYVLSVLTTLLGKQVHKILSKEIFGHILLFEPMSRVYTRSVGHYITLAGDDAFRSGTIVTSILQTIVGFLTAAIGMAVLFQFSPILFGSVMAFLALSLLLIGGLIKIVISLNSNAASMSRDASTTFIEALNSLRSIRALHSERFTMNTYAMQMHSYIKTLVELDAIKTGVKAFPAIALLLLATIGLRPNAHVSMTDATLFAGTIIIIRVFASLGQMVTAAAQLLTDIRAVKDIGSLLELANEKKSTSEIQAQEAVQTINLENLSFGYGERGRVLNNVSFQFEAGHTYAIVGSSGTGKSTLADIMLGLTAPDTGKMLVNAGKLPLDLARARFTLVEQQPKIFSTTVKENLLLGIQASDVEIQEALKTVNLDDMIYNLPLGLATRLTYLGENFSGGQRQRLGIARALVRQPDVLILDEATSALDPQTRQEVVTKLRTKMQNGIIIFITHDPEIAALADEVLSIGEVLPEMTAVRSKAI